MNNDIFKSLEPDEPVPDYLKEALVSEIDFIRDAFRIVALYTDGLFSTALLCLSEASKLEKP